MKSLQTQKAERRGQKLRTKKKPRACSRPCIRFAVYNLIDYLALTILVQPVTKEGTAGLGLTSK